MNEGHFGEKDVTLSATGNGTKPRDQYNAFLTVSGGDGNLGPGEVHLLLRTNDGEFAQGWFRLTDLNDALTRITPPGSTEGDQ